MHSEPDHAHRVVPMRHLRLLVLLFVAMLCGSVARASHSLHDLQIKVVLSKNGDAHITETRQMTIDTDGTECYIVIGNLNGSEVRDLQVKDETGLDYTNIGHWDIDKSRSQKAGRCGIVRKEKGYELCWGIGDAGERTYITSYTVTGLVKDYPDADGFNYMFVARDIKPLAKHVHLIIVPEWAEEEDKQTAVADTTSLNYDNTGVWGFNFRGEINVVDGAIVAESSEPFIDESAMIVMARFEKGVFDPEMKGEGTFEQLKERAFEGSDYLEEESSASLSDVLETMAYILFIVVVPIVALIWYIVYMVRARKKVKENLVYYRGIPNHGNLEWANGVFNAYRFVGSNYDDLLAANVLKLVNLGAVGIEQGFNAKGKLIQFFVIRNLPSPEQQSDLLRQIHRIFVLAAGDDAVLEPWELKQWMKDRHNQGITDRFINTLHVKTSVSDYKYQLEEVRQLYGLKKYLKDFSLLGERHLQEVWLWKDYMIYATLFGIADQVIKDMKNINPQFFNMDVVANTMADTMTLPVIYSAFSRSTRKAVDAKAQREARASGRGGSSSWGGGGGFSGGGSGGGVR